MNKISVLIILISICIVSCTGDNYYNIATFYIKQGNDQKAIEYFSKAIEKNPKDANAYFNRAHIQQKIGGRNLQVIFDYTKAIEFNPKDNQAYMNRGVANLSLGNKTDAMNDYLKSIEIDPEYPIVYENLGNLYELQSDSTKACENWRKSLKMGNEKVRKRINTTCN